MIKSSAKLVIESVVEDGKKFRPSDWIERISTVTATFGADHRLHYADGVQPRTINGEKCLVVDKSLEDSDPVTYQYILRFARTNRLRMREECLDD